MAVVSAPVLAHPAAMTERFLELCVAGNKHLETQDLDCAKVCFLRALELHVATPEQEMEIHFTLGSLCDSTSNWDEAIRQFAQATDLAKTVGKRTRILQCTRALAKCVFAKALLIASRLDEESLAGNSEAFELLDHGAELYTTVRQLAQEENQPELVVESLRCLSRIQDALGNDEGAIGMTEQYLAAARETSNQRSLHDALSTMAMVLSRLGQGTKADYDRLLELRWEQAAVATTLREPVHAAQAYYALGVMFEEAGSFAQYYGPAKARECYARALEMVHGLSLKELGPTGAELVRVIKARQEGLEQGNCVLM